MQWAHLVSSLILSEFSSKSAKDLQRVPNGLWEDPACRFSKPEVKNSSCGTRLVSPPGNLLFDYCHYYVSSLLHFKKLKDNWMHKLTNCFLKPTGWLEEFSRSLSHQNYTFWTQKILLVTLRHPRSLGFQLCMPIFHIHLCTVGQFVFTWPKIWNCPQGQTKANKIFIFINFNPGEP